jgi:hypothetical protein
VEDGRTSIVIEGFFQLPAIELLYLHDVGYLAAPLVDANVNHAP